MIADGSMEGADSLLGVLEAWNGVLASLQALGAIKKQQVNQIESWWKKNQAGAGGTL